MTPDQWERIKELVDAGLDRNPDARARFLDEACVGDPSLRDEVAQLIASYEQAGDFMAATAGDAATELLTDRDVSLVGQRMGAYRIVHELGQGGMGTVYLAVRADEAYRKEVAVKALKRGMDTAAIIRSFRTERQILATLDHPNIARLLDGGTTTDGRPYFVMDYVEGLPLDVYCDTHTLAIPERLRLFRTVCAAVHDAHQHGVIHRDLKPGKILVTPAGTPKLLDFGIAKVLNPDLASATIGSVTMMRPLTPAYASPEQIRGEPITAASDVYSLGVVLFELLTGHRPYHLRRHSPHELEHVIGEEAPDKPSTIVDRTEHHQTDDDGDPVVLTPASVSEARGEAPGKLRQRLRGDLDTIVLTALRKEPERRYASVAHLSEDIRRYLDNLPVVARPDTLTYRAAKFVRRNRTSVITAGLSVALTGVLFGLVGLHSFTPRPQSLAVLPFKPLVPAARDDYLELGIADAVITNLSRLRQLVVRPPTAIAKYAGNGPDPVAAGRELRVDAVLDGSVQRLGDRIKVTLRLIRVRDGQPLWADEVEQRSDDLFRVQTSIAERTAAALALTLTGAEKSQLNRRDTTNSEAYQLYLQGRYFWNKRTEESLKRAAVVFQQATEKDPNYALAYVGLADSYIQLGIDDIGGLAPNEAFPKATEAALTALTIDNTLAEAHAALGFAKLQYDWDWHGAERELEDAIRLNANYAAAHQWYGLYLSRVGRHEQAIHETMRAYELDPVSLAIGRAVGFRFYEARRYDQAIEHLRKTLELEPNYAQARYTLGLAYVQTGQFDDAVRELQEGIRLSGGNRTISGALGYAYARAGRTVDSHRVLDTLMAPSDGRYVSPYNIALIFAGLGDADRAFAWLERAYQTRASRLGWLAVLPEFDSLRPDPRFKDLLRRIGLPVTR
jgi:serine/threonine protein kinase/TolB-like protein